MGVNLIHVLWVLFICMYLDLSLLIVGWIGIMLANYAICCSALDN